MFNQYDEVTIGLDCSGFIRYIYWLAGFPDIGPKFLSQTPRNSLLWQELSETDALPGDIIVFAAHIVIYNGPGNPVFEEPSHIFPTQWGYSTNTRFVSEIGVPTFFRFAC